MRAILALLVVWGMATPTFAYHGAGLPLELGGGARALGMGGAFLAVADDEWATLSNPAGLSGLRRWGFTGTHARQFGAVSVTTLGVAGPWLGVLLTVVDSGLIEPDLSYVALGGVAAAGIPVWGGLSVGVRGRAVRNVAPGDAAGWAVDGALLWRGPVVVALLWEALWAEPIGGSGSHSEPWPQRLALGAALPLPLPRPVSGQVAASVEGLGTGPLSVRGGGELWLQGLGLRAGLSPGTFSYGLSVRLGGLQLDWATVLHGILGPTYRGTVTIRFQ